MVERPRHGWTAPKFEWDGAFTRGSGLGHACRLRGSRHQSSGTPRPLTERQADGHSVTRPRMTAGQVRRRHLPDASCGAGGPLGSGCPSSRPIPSPGGRRRSLRCDREERRPLHPERPHPRLPPSSARVVGPPASPRPRRAFPSRASTQVKPLRGRGKGSGPGFIEGVAMDSARGPQRVQPRLPGGSAGSAGSGPADRPPGGGSSRAPIGSVPPEVVGCN